MPHDPHSIAESKPGWDNGELFARDHAFRDMWREVSVDPPRKKSPWEHARAIRSAEGRRRRSEVAHQIAYAPHDGDEVIFLTPYYGFGRYNHHRYPKGRKYHVAQDTACFDQDCPCHNPGSGMILWNSTSPNSRDRKAAAIALFLLIANGSLHL